MTALPTTYRLRPDVRFRIVAGEAVVLRQDDAEVLVLNGVASRMLELLASGMPGGEIRTRLAEEYEVEPDELARDLEEFASELEGAGVLRARGDDDPTEDER